MTILDNIKDAVIEGNEELAIELVKQAIEAKFNVEKIMLDGLAKGMLEVGNKYENKEYFLPEIIISADACQSGMKILKKETGKTEIEYKSTIVIGTVRGDIHEIGKNITKYF